jgi:SAM-dependent methyltransferase
MLHRAAERGIEVVTGVAEALSFADETFDTPLIVTTICFVDDVASTLEEARRILSPDGQLVIGYIDKESPGGQQYQQKKDENPFYRDATFVSTDELVEMLDVAGFGERSFVQTLFHTPDDLTKPDRVTDGYGDGLFVGLKAQP